MLRIAFLLLATGTLFAQGDEKKEEDPRKLHPDHAPTPFTAAEIRDACGEGRTSTFRVKSGDADVILRTFTFKNCTESGTDLTLSATKEDGTALGEPATRHASWKRLQSHGSYPAKNTVISAAMIEIPAGKFDCHLYKVTTKKEGKVEVARIYFAKKLPGPPVLMEKEIDGRTVFKMQLVKHKDGKKRPKKPEPKPEK